MNRFVLFGLAGVAVFALSLSSCSVGSGTGTVTGSLDVANCWSGCYDLKPTFFGASPYESTLQIRIQRGSDYESFSDGLSILVDDVTLVRANYLGKHIAVALPPGVTPPGIPVIPVANPAGVHASLYLQATCPTEDVALYGMDNVELGPGGACSLADPGGVADASELFASCFADAGEDAGAGANAADAASDADAGSDAGSDDGGTPEASWIQFDALFDGDPDESSAADRLIEGSFDLLLADPRQMDPSGLTPPPCNGHLVGNFHFYYERGQPAQPFP